MKNKLEALSPSYNALQEQFSKITATVNAINDFSHLSKFHVEESSTANEIVQKIAEERRKYRELQSAGAQASIESRDQLIEQNKVLKQQLTEQNEINQRLEAEFETGAREAVITRRIAYWSLGVGIAGVITAIIAIIVGAMK